MDLLSLCEASIPQVTECCFEFVEQKSDGIILIEMVVVCIFQYRTFSH